MMLGRHKASLSVHETTIRIGRGGKFGRRGFCGLCGRRNSASRMVCKWCAVGEGEICGGRWGPKAMRRGGAGGNAGGEQGAWRVGGAAFGGGGGDGSKNGMYSPLAPKDS